MLSVVIPMLDEAGNVAPLILEITAALKAYPPVAMFADTIRQLESVASANLVPQEQIDTLTYTYRLYRTHLHHRSLDGKGAVLPAADFESERSTIVAIWDSVMGA